MKAILYLDGGFTTIVDFLTPPQRKERETQGELEARLVRAFNVSQPNMAHKVVRIKLMRN